MAASTVKCHTYSSSERQLQPKHTPKTISFNAAVSRRQAASRRAQCRSHAMPSSIADVAVALDATSAVVGAGVTVVAALAAWRLYVYAQMEVITASMLSKYVPKGGCKVIQIGGSTKELYYYPSDTREILVVNESGNEGLYQTASINARVPAVLKKSAASDLSWCGASSVDVVVVKDAAMSRDGWSACVRDIARVLKPNGRLVLLQPLRGSGLTAALQSVSGSAGKAVTEDDVSAWLGDSSVFSDVKMDVALQQQDPHAVGVATRAVARRKAGSRKD